MHVKSKAIVIKRSKVSGADVVIKALTRDFGVQKFYVNGARHTKSKFSASTQLFTEGEFSFFLRPNFSSIESVIISERHQGIIEKYSKFVVASHMLELVDKFVMEGVHDAKLYDFFSSALAHFEAEDDADIKRFRLIFTIKFLKRLGYAPPDNLGGLEAPEHDFIKYSLEKPYIALSNLRTDAIIHSRVDEFLRQFIEEYVTDKKLKTYDLLKDFDL